MRFYAKQFRSRNRKAIKNLFNCEKSLNKNFLVFVAEKFTFKRIDSRSWKVSPKGGKFILKKIFIDIFVPLFSPYISKKPFKIIPTDSKFLSPNFLTG